MNSMSLNKNDFKLKTPCSFIVSGQAGGGKSTLIARILRSQDELLDKPFERVLYCFSVMTPGYRELLRDVPQMELYEGIPTMEEITRTKNTALILDDLLAEFADHKIALPLGTRFRHLGISLFFITQNFYYRSKFIRTLNLNSTYIIIFPNLMDASMITTLNRQMFPNKPRFLQEAFEDTTRKAHGYLFIDLHPDTNPQLRVRNTLFPSESCVFYLPI